MQHRIKLFLVFSLWSQLLYATEPALHIQSIKADIQYKAGMVVYTGEVVMDQGDSRLVADKLITYHDKQHQLIKAIAFGNLAHLRQLATKEQAELHAYAKRIEYYPHQHLVILIDKAKIVRENNTLEAPYIRYNTQTQVLSSQSSKTERTKIILQKTS